MMRVAVLRFEELPNLEEFEMPEDFDDGVFFADDELLVQALQRRGVEAEALGWNSARLLANEFDVAVVRSAWDYVERREEFLAAVERIEASGSRVVNPVEALRWNSAKTYLQDLDRAGIPTVPTYLAEHDDAVSRLEGSDFAVLKPIVGSGGKGVVKVRMDDLPEVLASLDRSRYVLQPFAQSVQTEGEWMFVTVAGRHAAAFLKKPKEGDFRAHALYGGSTDLAEPSQEDLAQVERMWSLLPHPVLYARFDLVRLDGRLAVMELELIEPVLYLQFAPHLADQLAEAVAELPVERLPV
jgi:glutathione synthase/RimK-type ligase-like ATP-grasp enzyme